MSQPFIASSIGHFNHATPSFDQLPISASADAVLGTAALELGFQPIHLLKFACLLLAFLVIPVLSTNNSFPRPLGHASRKPASKHARRRRRLTRCQLPASYQPPQAVVDAPFIPLPTRRHFRISHAGNQPRRPAADNVLYTAQSSSESDEYASEDALRPEPLQHFHLVFGKRLRGEEEEFRGPSAMKGSRLASRAPRQPSGPSTPPSAPTAHTPRNSPGAQGHHSQPKEAQTLGQQRRPASHKKAISFAATTQACTHRISTQIDSSLSFLSCQLK